MLKDPPPSLRDLLTKQRRRTKEIIESKYAQGKLRSYCNNMIVRDINHHLLRVRVEAVLFYRTDNADYDQPGRPRPIPNPFADRIAVRPELFVSRQLFIYQNYLLLIRRIGIHETPSLQEGDMHGLEIVSGGVPKIDL